MFGRVCTYPLGSEPGADCLGSCYINNNFFFACYKKLNIKVQRPEPFGGNDAEIISLRLQFHFLGTSGWE